jgi:D-lactate dehydrogenase (cytochrome)
MQLRRGEEASRTLAAALAPQLGERLLTAEAARAQYSRSEGHHGEHLPDLVVRPESAEEVQRLVRAAAEHQVPIVPFGAGTSLEGNAAAVRGGLCLDLSGMNRVLEVAAEDMLCVVEPGVTREQLNAELRSTGLFFPVDPGANATMAGMIATRASGTNAVRYGTMRENVLALKVVLADGSIVRTGTRARKSAAGYDSTHLFVGSEGTLGITVEATLRLHGLPETVLAGIWPFATLDGAVQTVIATIQSGIPRGEDGAARRRRHPRLQPSCWPGSSRAADPVLELHGSEAGCTSSSPRSRRSASSWAAARSPAPLRRRRGAGCGRRGTKHCLRRAR